MEPYVCSECGGSYYYEHDIRKKHGKIYCERCYLRYTTTGSDVSHDDMVSPSPSGHENKDEKKPTKHGKPLKGHAVASSYAHGEHDKKDVADSLFHLIMLPFVWVYDAVSYLISFLFIKPFTWVYEEFSSFLSHLGKGVRHLSNATLGLIKIIIFLGLCYLAITLIFGNGIDKARAYALDLKRMVPIWKNCSSTLESGTCAPNKPFYCDGGVLVQRSDICGCENNSRVFQNTCIESIKCDDGTFWPDCSSNKPYQCQKDGLIQNSSACGCPVGQVPDGNACKIAKNCHDGTIEGKCSPNQPYYCVNGNLVERASVCGCPSGTRIESINDHNTERCIISNSYSQMYQLPNKILNTNTLSNSAERKSECKEAFNLVNSHRAQNERATLMWDEGAYNLAVARSKDMFQRNYIDHVTPEGTCAKDMMSQYGLSGAENLAENVGGMTHYSDGTPISTTSVNEAVNGWMVSRGHRYNLLYPSHTKGAIGCYMYVCVFYGINTEPFGLGAGPCTTGAEGLAYWNTVGAQPGET